MSRITGILREAVRKRASARCEYCHKPETYSAHSFHADHIIAQKHGGADGIENLAWACFQCNTNKGSDVASYDAETGALTPLFNPRQHRWNEHFSLHGALLVGITPIGRVTIRVLQMNHEDQLEVRQVLLDAGLW